MITLGKVEPKKGKLKPKGKGDESLSSSPGAPNILVPPVVSAALLPTVVMYGSPTSKGTPTFSTAGTPSFPTLSNSRSRKVPLVCRNGSLTSATCPEPEPIGTTLLSG